MTDLNSETPPKQSFASKYRRPLIAVCMVVLMLAFLIPSQLPNLRRQTNQKFGTLNGKVIRAADLRDSHNRWNYLKRVVVQTQRGRVPLVHAIFGPGSSSDKLIGMLDRHPEAYMLLLKEAHEDGPGGSDMAATDLIDSGFSGERGRVPIEVVLEEDRVENLSQLDMEAAAPYRAALSDLLAILNRADMLSRSIKPSIPLVDRRVAATDQSITAQLLEFRSADYVSRVAAPTDEQLNQQFKRFAANPRGQLAPENEFGFGYKIPNRVKLQVIQIPGDAVRELVRNSKDVNPDRDDPTLPYGWVVEAYKEYSLNKWKYIPAPDESATQPTSAPTEPRPFPQVRREIVEALISQETAKKMQQIEQRIRNRIEGDYQTWKTAREINAPATQSSFNVTFESVEYLNELANDIERQFGVRLTIASYADRFYDANDLSQLADIGRSFLPLGSGVQMQPLPFGSYAIDLFVPFIEEHQLDDVSRLSLDLLELSDVMQQSFIGNDRFMFRVTAYQAAHEASEIGELRPRVEEDWKRVEALKLAHADAEAAMKNAASVGALASSTNGAGTSSVKITPREGAPESLGLSQVAGAQFVEKSVYALLDAKLENNLAVFDVPLADRSYVAQRSEIEPTWQTETDYLRTRAMESISLMSNLMMADFREPGLAPDRVTREYFDLENIYRRNNFVPELQGKDDDEPATQPAK